ncbi:MAG TPA: tetratricopeptide repeat protein [Gemmatimonadales bacterium]|nr:tetratricopeptide repeat protein [Gemmatimonadales bacterium]
MSILRLAPALAVALGACALKGDVRRVETQVAQLRQETARADSARAVSLGRRLDDVLALQRAVLDSLNAQQRRLTLAQGELRNDLTDVQRQLVQIQELMGQSQQRLSELRGQFEQRRQQVAAPPPGGGATTPGPAPGEPGPEQLYDLAVRQLRGGSPQTARQALQKLLTDYPQHDRVPDALFQLAESWAGTSPDSAAGAYERIAKEHPNSTRAPAALYKLGLLAEQRGDPRAARVYYQRVVAGYPRSEEAALARTKLSGPGG